VSRIDLGRRLLREFDQRRLDLNDRIVDGAFATLEQYRAACSASRTWLAAREIVLTALGPDDTEGTEQ
jgi:hypothetical protein